MSKPESKIQCILERTAPIRGSIAERWIMVLVVDGKRSGIFAESYSALTAIEEAQNRAADFVRGLQDLHDRIEGTVHV